MLKIKPRDQKKDTINRLLDISENQKIACERRPRVDFDRHTNDMRTYVPKSSEFRDNFYKTKSIVKQGIDANPLLCMSINENLIKKSFDNSLIKGERSNSNSKRDTGFQTSNKSFYDSVGPIVYSHQKISGRSTLSTCGHHGSPCCSKFGALTTAGTHCCHCYLIKSDIRNSNHKYNAALVTLNTGSVLRSLIKESHCEENH